MIVMFMEKKKIIIAFLVIFLFSIFFFYFKIGDLSGNTVRLFAWYM